MICSQCFYLFRCTNKYLFLLLIIPPFASGLAVREIQSIKKAPLYAKPLSANTPTRYKPIYQCARILWRNIQQGRLKIISRFSALFPFPIAGSQSDTTAKYFVLVKEDGSPLDSGTVCMNAKGVVPLVAEHDGRAVLPQCVSSVDPFSLLQSTSELPQRPFFVIFGQTFTSARDRWMRLYSSRFTLEL